MLARAPIAGRAKTRLIPRLGAVGAARFQEASLQDVDRLVSIVGVPGILFLSPLSARSRIRPLRLSLPIAGQGGGSLGTRMASALERLLRLPEIDRALVIGTDSPDLPARLLRDAARSLREHPAVLVPAADGGYVAFGVHGAHLRSGELRRVLRPVPWSSPHTCDLTAEALRAGGLEPLLLDTWFDIDEPSDLDALRARLAGARSAHDRHPDEVAPHTAAFLREWQGPPDPGALNG
ncbi:MAG: TIGR04282 family arsenosugar biosynthesis glycosyltransferase [Candidatus Eisenbacteria bacterium]